MAELMHFQPGKAFYDAYQGARGNTLAKLAITGEGEQRKSALADLYGLDPSLASQAQAQIGKNDEQDYSELVQSAKVMYSLKGRPEADMMWQRVAPKFSQKYGIQFNPTPQPSDWDAIEKIVQATDAGGQGALPSDVQSFEYFTKDMTPEQKRQARENKVGLNKNGDWKTTIDPDTKTPVQSNGLGGFRYFDFNTRQWIDISGQGQGGGTPDENVEFSSLPPEEQEAVTVVGNKINNHVAIKDGKVVPVVNPGGYYGSNEPAPSQQTATNPLAKPKEIKEPAPATWNAPVVETRGGKQVRVRYGTYNGQPIEQVMGEAEITPEAPKPATADERSARGYLDRMAAAEGELDKLVSEGFTPNVKDFYTAGEGAALNWMATPKGQVWRQQQEDWVRAKLRRESGAAIPPDEMDREIKTYFPQPGDSRDVIEAKKRSRGMARQQFVTMAGSAAPSAPNKPAGGTKPATANPPARNSKGWVLEEDKNGKKAYVSPDRKQYEAIP